MKGNRKDPNVYPSGWDAARVRRVVEHYEKQTEDQAVAEDEAAWSAGRRGVTITVPPELLPAVRALIAKNMKRRNAAGATARRRRSA